MLKRVGSYAGIVIGVLGVAFVVRELLRDRETVVRALSDVELPWLVPSLLVGFASMTVIGLVWRRCLKVLGAELPALDALRRYFVGQMGKYVPGGIWPVIGRAEMARRGGVAGPVAYGSTVLSLALTYLAATLVAGIGLLLGAGRGEVALIGVVALLPLGLLVLHPSILTWLLTILRRLSRRELLLRVPRWSTSAGLLLAHVPAWLGISLATWLVAASLDPSGANPWNLTFATTLSWLIGFLAVGVPGGIGVREAVFVATATSLSGSGVAAAVAVIARAIFIIVDLGGAGITSVLAARSRFTVKATEADSGGAEGG